MGEWLQRLQQRPWFKHLMRAVTRYLGRLGMQFAAAITYFSVLSLVPILLFAFAVAGFVLTVLRPELIPAAVNAVSGSLGGLDTSTRENLTELLVSTLGNWRGVGVVALLSAIYSGAGWMGNLKDAVRAQWRPTLEFPADQANIVVKTLVNLVTLVGLIVLIAITFGLASISTNLAESVLDLLGLSSVGWLKPVFQFTPIVFSIGAGWLMFMYLFTVLPEERAPRWSPVRKGALMGAIGLGLLQYLTGILFAVFGANRAASIFGPVIVLMLFFNLFAQLILFVSAWVATADQPALGTAEDSVRFALTPAEVDEPAPVPDAAAEPVLVPQSVAVRTTRIGTGIGYVTGAATGLGVGAVLAGIAAWIGRRRR